jgi:hypothetical protein
VEVHRLVGTEDRRPGDGVAIGTRGRIQWSRVCAPIRFGLHGCLDFVRHGHARAGSLAAVFTTDVNREPGTIDRAWSCRFGSLGRAVLAGASVPCGPWTDQCPREIVSRVQAEANRDFWNVASGKALGLARRSDLSVMNQLRAARADHYHARGLLTARIDGFTIRDRHGVSRAATTDVLPVVRPRTSLREHRPRSSGLRVPASRPVGAAPELDVREDRGPTEGQPEPAAGRPQRVSAGGTSRTPTHPLQLPLV